MPQEHLDETLSELLGNRPTQGDIKERIEQILRSTGSTSSLNNSDAEMLVDLIAQLDNGLERENYMSEIVGRSGYNIRALRTEVGRRRNQMRRQRTNTEASEEGDEILRAPFRETENAVYQQCYDYNSAETYFIKFDGKKYERANEIIINSVHVLPNVIEFEPRERTPVVQLASYPEDYGTVSSLLSEIDAFIYKYGDIFDIDRKFLSAFTIYTWIYDRTEVTPYTRFMGDTGKGKTRMLKIIWQLCYNSFMASASSTISGALRMQSKWQGTALFNEADFGNTEEASMFIKWVNNGFEKHIPLIMTNRENPDIREIFDTFGPKGFAMKKPFADSATEGRLMSINMYETRRRDIPIILSSEFYRKGLLLRNKLLDFRLKNYKTITSIGQEHLERIRLLDVEPRLKQIMIPLLPIISMIENGTEEFVQYIKTRQQEVRRQRADSWEGAIFNIVYTIATGDSAYENEFNELRNDEGSIVAITPKMIAEELRTSTKYVTGTLKSIGFDVKVKRVPVRRERQLADGQMTMQTERKPLRIIIIPKWSAWAEAVSRYYIDYDALEGIPDVPALLKDVDFEDDR